MCFTIQLCGFAPRCALDLKDSSESRFHKILDLIGECGLSIHDISRVQLDPDSKLPRFNMPLELGADLGLRIKGPKIHRDRRLLILDSEKHQYDITMSDLSGQDIEAHHNSEPEIIACVRDWLNVGPKHGGPLPGADAIQADFAKYKIIVPDLIRDGKLDAYERLSHTDFLWTVHVALEQMRKQPGSAGAR
jgi:hypothetical protein